MLPRIAAGMGQLASLRQRLIDHYTEERYRSTVVSAMITVEEYAAEYQCSPISAAWEMVMLRPPMTQDMETVNVFLLCAGLELKELSAERGRV